VSTAADVYALGSTLFEVLTLSPLHPGRSIREIAASTLRGVDAKSVLRAAEHDVPPELEALVLGATKLDPEERISSARELHLAIERYLDGERDEALRREQAEGHAREAARLAEAAREERGSAQAARRAAMREIGRALALQPGNSLALDLMVQLLTKPPPDLPAEVQQEIDGNERHRIRSLGRIGAFAYASLILYLPLLVWCGVRSWPWVLALYGFSIAAAATSLSAWYSRAPTSKHVLGVMILSNIAFAATAALFGPLLLTPMLLSVNTSGFALNSRPSERRIAGVVASVSFAAVLLLWFSGVVPGGYTFNKDGGMSILPGAIDLPELPVLVLLGIAALGGVLTALMPAGRVRDTLAASERQLFVYAWHLRELVPEAVRGPTDPTSQRRRAA
jgi:serine/threonine-protein kinase